jgi:sigma-B regulation protein RsbU (phosphoserine phosphatase)
MGVGVFLFWELLGGLALAVGRRARDRAARRQSRVFELSLRGLSEGVVVADAAGRLVFFNAEAERVLGMGPRNVGVPEWSATYGCFYPDAVTPFPSEQLPLARALNGEEATEEAFIRNQSVPDGVWIAISGMPLRDERGVVEGGVVSVRDVTTARKADEQLRASIKQLEDLQYAVNQSSLVAITDEAGTITYVNNRFSEVSGYAREELLGQNHRILKSGYHPTAYFEDLWGTIVRGQVWRGRICNRARDGSHFWVDTTIVPLMTDGRPTRYLAIRTDITHHMRQEAELARLSSAVEQTADAIIITDVSGVIEYVNPAFEATTGYSRAEAVGQTPRIMKSGLQSPEYYTRLWATLASGEVFRGTLIDRRKNGECYHAEQTITPIRDLQGRVVHYVSVLKDITDRIRIEQRNIEMRYAREVQQRLYPVAAPQLRGFDIAGATFPALETGGDYYDYLPVSDSCLDVVIGDVSGHGLGSALIMAETRAYLRSLSGLAAEPGAALTRINNTLCADLDDNRYVALVLARLDASSMRLAYANAGHVAAYHLDSSGAVRTVLDSCGPPLGMLPDATYACSQTHALRPGDVVVFLTDGITECENEAGAAFGSDAALDVVRAHRDDSAQDIVRHLERATREFGGAVAQQDDVTVVICKVGR